MEQVDQMMTAADVGRILNVVPNRVRQLADSGALPSVRTVGGFRLFKQSDVDALAARRAEQTERRAAKTTHVEKRSVEAVPS